MGKVEIITIVTVLAGIARFFVDSLSTGGLAGADSAAMSIFCLKDVARDETPAPAPVIIKAKAEIAEWNDNSCNLKVEGGTTLKLDITEAKISGGYVPQAGDQVIIFYNKDSMKLAEIQLEYRAADEAA